MTQTSSDDFWQVPAEMVRLAKQETDPTSEEMEALRAYLELRCAHFEAADADRILQASGEPGYLEAQLSGRRLFVPFHLGPFFPKAELFREVVNWADRVALMADNPICVSGSTTFLDVLDEIGDLDFCEYHLETAADLPALVAAKAADSEDMSLIEVKCQTRHYYPWQSLLEWADQTARHPIDPAPIKLDFVSRGALLGLLPTTSLVLPIGDAPEGTVANRSFSYQEAVLAKDKPPRSLLRPESLASYLLWLLDDARNWLSDSSKAELSKRGPKALKRLLSAAMLLGETSLVEEVVRGLRVQAVKEVTLLGKAKELEGMLARLPEAVSSRYSGAVQDQLNRIALTPDQIEEVMTELVEIGREILEELEDLLSMGDAQ